MGFKEKTFLVVVDFHSHFPEPRMLNQRKGEDVIAALKSIFAIHGVPKEVIADNMPFGSLSVALFTADWGFKVTTSSPKSNGLAERYVQTVKQYLRKAANSKEDLYESFLVYRQTPLTGMPYSPSEMLFNQNIRGPLPCTTDHLKPKVVEAYKELQQRQLIQKSFYDRSAKVLPPLKEGDEVVVRTNTSGSRRKLCNGIKLQNHM